jgi:hypothetical protein
VVLVRVEAPVSIGPDDFGVTQEASAEASTAAMCGACSVWLALNVR